MKRTGFRSRAPRHTERDPDRVRATPAAVPGAYRAPQPVVAGPRSEPKTIAHRNSHLRDMARGMPCLLQVAGVCNHDSTTVVCCHGNGAEFGKATSRKADDFFSCWGCAACHHWLDRGQAPRALKQQAFMAAHLRQVLEWRAIAFDSRSNPKDRAAAQWALERLNATPVGETP